MEPAALLREARRQSRLSQYEVATEAGCSQSTVARVERGDREPSLAVLDQMLAACGFQLRLQLEPLDTALDERIEALATAEVRSSLTLLSLTLLHLAPRLVDAGVPFAVDGVAAAILYGFALPYDSLQLRIQEEPEALKAFARELQLRRDTDPTATAWDKDLSAFPRLRYIYDLCDPDAHWLTGYTPLQVRTQRADPQADAVTINVQDHGEHTTVPVVPLQRLILPRTYERALARSRRRFADLDRAHGAGEESSREL